MERANAELASPENTNPAELEVVERQGVNPTAAQLPHGDRDVDQLLPGRALLRRGRKGHCSRREPCYLARKKSEARESR